MSGITYANEETGYTVARVATDRSSDLLTVVGPLLGAQPGESLRLRGRWRRLPQYGRQFEVEAYQTVLPATIQGIRRYLGSGLIKGIGPQDGRADRRPLRPGHPASDRGGACPAVTAAARRSLDRTITVRAAGRSWTVTPAALGRRAAVSQAVSQAVGGPRLPWWASVWHRLTRRPVRFQVGLAYSGGQRGAAAMAARVASAVAVAPQGAAITLVHGAVRRRHARNGRALDLRAASQALTAAEGGDSSVVNLPVRSLTPRVTDGRLGTTITIDVGANRLTLYDGLTVQRTYPVATAGPGFYTPRGTWRVLYKQVNPTWINPAPHGWGAGEPARIPPGPDDPLGTRALALNAPGILIHGRRRAGRSAATPPTAASACSSATPRTCLPASQSARRC